MRTRIAVDFFPHVNSEMYLERLAFTPLLTFSAAPHDEIRLLAKRVIDVLVAGAALVVLVPFMLLVALAIRLTSPGPRHLPPGALRPERPAIRLLQIPLDVPERRRHARQRGAHEHAHNGHEDSATTRG